MPAIVPAVASIAAASWAESAIIAGTLSTFGGLGVAATASLYGAAAGIAASAVTAAVAKPEAPSAS
jgi:hypothetical protein